MTSSPDIITSTLRGLLTSFFRNKLSCSVKTLNKAGKSEKFGYVTASPDGTYVLAAGVREKKLTSSGYILQRFGSNFISKIFI